MQSILNLLQERKDEFSGNTKNLNKLIKKIESSSHAPTSEKHCKRMQPFANSAVLVDYVNKVFLYYFQQRNNFNPDAHSLSSYEIKESWYLFTFLIYSDKVEETVLHILKQMKEDKNSDLSIARRILNFCDNPVYVSQLAEIEEYFKALNENSKIYQWLASMKVTPPDFFNWEFTIRFKASPKADRTPSITDNLSLTLKGHTPKGNGKSFEIELKDQSRKISSDWDDCSTEQFIRSGNNKIQLSVVPTVDNLPQFMTEIETIFGLEFDRSYQFNYFSKGFKGKKNIQKWFLEN